jgi:hypothetical protein
VWAAARLQLLDPGAPFLALADAATRAALPGLRMQVRLVAVKAPLTTCSEGRCWRRGAECGA